jgi:aminopeptidase N
MKNKNMKYLQFFVMTILITSISFSTTIAQQTDSDKKFPHKNEMRLSNLDIKHIAINLKFDWHKKQAYGTTSIILSVINATDKINLDAGMLTINSIVLANGNALKFNYDCGDKKDGLEIILDKTYNTKEELIIKIDYHTNWINTIDPNNLSGVNGKGLRFSQPTFNDPIKPKEIWSFGDPESNRYWFPSFDSPSD